MGKTEEDFFKQKIEEAIRITQKVDSNYRSQAFAEVLRFLLTSEDKRMLPSPPPRQSLATAESDPITFLVDRQVTSHSDRVLVMAYFLEKSEQKEGFTVSDMKDMYNRCRVKEPANLFDTISKQEKKGLLRVKEEREGAKVYVLTLEGIKYVENLSTMGSRTSGLFPDRNKTITD